MDDKVAAALLTQAVLAGIQSVNPQEFERQVGAIKGVPLDEGAIRVVDTYFRKMLDRVRNAK